MKLSRWGLALSLWLMLLSGCSSYRVAYNNLDWLLFGWVEDYVELTSAQHAALEPLVRQWHAQHRQTQLPQYQALLFAIRVGVQSPPLDQALLEQWRIAVEPHWLALRSSLVPLAVALLEQIDQDQQQQLLGALRKKIESQREAYLERSAAERVEHRYDTYRERMRRWIGRLGSAQRDDLKRLVVALPDGELQWLGYRSLWVDELEQALMIRSDKRQFHAQIQALILSPNSFRIEALQNLLTSSRRQRSDYMVALINGLTAQQRDHLLSKLDALIDAVGRLHLEQD